MNESKENIEDALAELSELSQQFQKAMDEIEQQEEEYWNSLDREQQLCCFNSVARRLLKGEIEERGSYRYVLYNVFKFGPEAYVRAQCAGFLALHNAIFDGKRIEEKVAEELEKFAKYIGITDDQVEKLVTKFTEKGVKDEIGRS